MLPYTGTYQMQTVYDGTGRNRKKIVDPYIPDPDLVEAVNLALLLQKPLLLMGEPGCGKSELAKAVAYEWYGNEYKDSYFEWNIKSTAKAADGLYEFDHLRRLRDTSYEANKKKVDDPYNYIDFGPVYKAFTTSEKDYPAVLLIDEIDKAEIDFPNDLLQEIDRYAFTIKETGETITADHKPFIVITSNRERTLPDAFLRRCIYHYIQPLNKEKLTAIVKGRHFDGNTPDDTLKNELIDKAASVFLKLRDVASRESLADEKALSTSEFLDWYQALKSFSSDAGQTPANFIAELDAFLADGNKPIRFGNTLFKTQTSLLRFNLKQPGTNATA